MCFWTCGVAMPADEGRTMSLVEFNVKLSRAFGIGWSDLLACTWSNHQVR